MKRQQWGSQLGFLAAAVGSAVGLGNIWRFSYVCYENGGGAFLIPYVIALLTAGIPLMILEFGLGHRKQGSAPKSMRLLAPHWEWVGWYAVVFVMFGIMLFYSVVIAWCVNYTAYSFNLSWDADTEDFFVNQFLGLQVPGAEGRGIFNLGAIRPGILLTTAAVWGAFWLICVRNIQQGIEFACRIFMPVLFFLTIVLVIWSLTLEGAFAGIAVYLTPDLKKLLTPEPWLAAYGQIFFSLSLGFGIMIAYASYLDRKANLVRLAMITSITNCTFSLIAGVAVFGTLGFMAGELVEDTEETAKFAELQTSVEEQREAVIILKEQIKRYQVMSGEDAATSVTTLGNDLDEKQATLAKDELFLDSVSNLINAKFERDATGDTPELIRAVHAAERQARKVAVGRVAAGGGGLAFIVYPKAINQLPGGQELFGIIFFSMLVFAGLSSGVSIIEAMSSALEDKFQIPRPTLITVLCLLGFLGSIPFTMQGGLVILEIFDPFLQNYGLIVVGIMECVIIGWFYQTLHIREHVDRLSTRPSSWWWANVVKFFLPVMLLYLLALHLSKETFSPMNLVYGWGLIFTTLAAGIILASLKWKTPVMMPDESEENGEDVEGANP